MPDGVFRYFPKPNRSQGRKKIEHWPLIEAAADHEWLRAHPYRLARFHRINLGTAGADWPVWIIACRAYDPCLPDGWRPAWLEIADDRFGDAPSFASPDWDHIVKNALMAAKAKHVLAVINHAALTRPDAMLVRDMLVALRSAELGMAAVPGTQGLPCGRCFPRAEVRYAHVGPSHRRVRSAPLPRKFLTHRLVPQPLIGPVLLVPLPAPAEPVRQCTIQRVHAQVRGGRHE